jgi:hypothetical protein
MDREFKSIIPINSKKNIFDHIKAIIELSDWAYNRVMLLEKHKTSISEYSKLLQTKQNEAKSLLEEINELKTNNISHDFSELTIIVDNLNIVLKKT